MREQKKEKNRKLLGDTDDYSDDDDIKKAKERKMKQKIPFIFSILGILLYIVRHCD